MKTTFFFPSHCLHRSFDGITSPSPRQTLHVDCICCTIPGPICVISIRTPRPLQVSHGITEPSNYNNSYETPQQMTTFKLRRTWRESFILTRTINTTIPLFHQLLHILDRQYCVKAWVSSQLRYITGLTSPVIDVSYHVLYVHLFHFLGNALKCKTQSNWKYAEIVT